MNAYPVQVTGKGRHIITPNMSAKENIVAQAHLEAHDHATR